MSYTYDAAGRRTSMTVLGQPTVNYTYDNADRLTQITQGTATVTLAYDPAGRRTSLTLPNGIITEYAYDAASRLTGLTYKQGTTTLGTLTYSYDAAGNRTQLGGTWARTGLPQAVASATYDAANQQLAFAGQTLTYDQNGNLTSDGTNTYTWNARNQLVAINGTGLTASFGYDGLGRRRTKTVNSTSADFLYDGLNPVQEFSGGSVVANLLTGLGIDEYFTRTDGGGSRFLLTDALGSTVALTDGTGALQTEYTYEPFGRTTATGPTSTNPFQYTGRENDGTGLYYLRARYYHPSLQRFISEEPHLRDVVSGCSVAVKPVAPWVEVRVSRNPLAVHAYAYVRNMPTRFVDRDGLQVWDPQDPCPPCPPTWPPNCKLEPPDYEVVKGKRLFKECHYMCTPNTKTEPPRLFILTLACDVPA